MPSFTACIDDRPWIPYTNPNLRNPGNMQLVMDSVASDLGVTVEVVALPWKRCLESLRSGKIDAMIGGADVPFTRELAVFPKHGNEVDTNRSLGTARIMLVKRSSSDVDWNGKEFINLARPVAVAMGTQVMINAVESAAAVSDQGGKTDDQNLRKLIQNRVDLMAGYEFDLKDLIEKNYPALVTMIPQPLVETHYYLAFSKQFHSRHSQFAEIFWNKIAADRNSVPSRTGTNFNQTPIISASALR
ncbi:MAG: transporter substrate-binding domain-containing protein [Proteobacteria bacterium]|nr:MAG: transporter substrate-binding domain-containing protein [Pseudomonadota bacterium]